MPKGIYERPLHEITFAFASLGGAERRSSPTAARSVMSIGLRGRPYGFGKVPLYPTLLVLASLYWLPGASIVLPTGQAAIRLIQLRRMLEWRGAADRHRHGADGR